MRQDYFFFHYGRFVAAHKYNLAQLLDTGLKRVCFQC